MKRILVVFAAFALVAAMAPAASAGCFPDKIFGHNSQSGDYNYLLNFDAGAPVVGAFWQPGLRSLANEGGYDASNWVREYFGAWYTFGFLGNAAVTGCPVGSMVVMVTQDLGTTATFAAMQANEVLANATVYYYATVNMTAIPQPGVTSSSRDGDNVVLGLTFGALDAGYSSWDLPGAPTTVISDFVLYTYQGADDPGRNAADWTLHSAIPYAGATTAAAGVTIDCSAGVRTYIAAGLRGTGEYDTAHVGASRFVECDPALADPDDNKFEMIRERRGTLRPSTARDR